MLTPFVVAQCDVHARLGIDATMEPWDLDRLLMAVARDTLHRFYPAMIAMEQQIAAAPVDQEWQLVSQLLDDYPLGLRIEAAPGIRGIDLHVEAGSVSRHDLMLLGDALEEVLATTLRSITA